MMSGLSDVLISDTICDPQHPVDLEPIRVEPPTLSMEFYANNSPLSGKDEGKFLTIHKIRERLQKEADVSVALNVDTESSREMVRVNARGELQLAVLIETMRREGYELAISRPRVIFKRDEKGEVLEPVERVTLEIPEDSIGPVMEELSRRKGELEDMVNEPNGTVRLVYRLPTRGLIGLRSTFLTLTRGLGLISNVFEGYQPYKGEVQSRSRGALIAKEPGKITRYAYEDIQERGELFYPVGTEVYGGMIVGECNKDEDMVVNITKTKAANNMRSSTSEATTVLDSHKEFSLEQALSWLRDDELLEVTPKTLRFRKEILDHSQRRVAERRGETAGI
jgi:GTP-binding protein